MVDFGDGFYADFEGVAYELRVRPVGSSDTSVRECKKYTWTVGESPDEETYVAYTLPPGFVDGDMDSIEEINSTDASLLGDRLLAESELVTGLTFEKVVL